MVVIGSNIKVHNSGRSGSVVATQKNGALGVAEERTQLRVGLGGLVFTPGPGEKARVAQSGPGAGIVDHGLQLQGAPRAEAGATGGPGGVGSGHNRAQSARVYAVACWPTSSCTSGPWSEGQ